MHDNLVRDVIWVLLSGLVGSLPTGYLITRWTTGLDIRKVGSGNPGATNVFRSVGRGAGLLTLAIDILKGWLPVYFAGPQVGNLTLAVLSGLAAVAGHTWSPFLKFRGGKGVATSAGVFAALLPGPTGAAVLAFAIGFGATRHVSVGSLAGAIVLPAAAFLLDGATPPSWLALALGLLIVVRHVPNIRRLLRGEELKLSLAGADGAPPSVDVAGKEPIAIIGGGSWGATLAHLLAQKGHDVRVWEFFPELAEAMEKTRKLKVMPQLTLHPSVRVTSKLAEALDGRRLVVNAVPSEFARRTFRAVRESNAFPAGAWIVSVTKGIETDTLKRMSEVIAEELPAARGRVAVLSGPSHAEEVALGVPTAVVSAGPGDLALRVQRLFNTDTFRVYTGTDFIGVELGGALKNIYAIACGVCDGLGLGDNTKAALMTRGLNEMIRVGIACGAHGLTFFGLSGMGDLIVTCGSRHSRNRLVGEKIGQGKTLQQALSEMTMVAEGVVTTKSGYQLAQRYRLELPIVNELYRCLYEGKPAKKAVQDLLTRPATGEMMHVAQLFK